MCLKQHTKHTYHQTHDAPCQGYLHRSDAGASSSITINIIVTIPASGKSVGDGRRDQKSPCGCWACGGAGGGIDQVINSTKTSSWLRCSAVDVVIAIGGWKSPWSRRGSGRGERDRVLCERRVWSARSSVSAAATSCEAVVAILAVTSSSSVAARPIFRDAVASVTSLASSTAGCGAPSARTATTASSTTTASASACVGCCAFVIGIAIASAWAADTTGGHASPIAHHFPRIASPTDAAACSSLPAAPRNSHAVVTSIAICAS